jgi:hypothetical protein
MASNGAAAYRAEMRYNVTLSAPGVEPKTYNVEGESEEHAKAKANSRFLAEHSTFNVSQFYVKAEVHPEEA